MSQLLLINPKGRTKMATRKKPRTAAQKAATRRMVAANRARRGGKRATVKHIAASAPSRRTRKAPSARLVRRRKANTVRGYFPNPAKRRRYAQNPIGLSVKGVGAMSMTALQGAGGALVVNTALNYVPYLPASLTSGNGKYLTRAAAAIALGTFGNKVLPRGVAQNMAVGALTVALHDLILGLAATAMPTMKLGDVGDYDTGVSEYVSEYVPELGDMSGVTNFDDAYSPIGEYVS